MIDISKGRFWDFGWKLIEGCDKCSPGCENCWSLAMEKRFRKGETSVRVYPERLNKPLKRKKPAVYAIWNDFHHKHVPHVFQADVYRIIEKCPQHTFIILTKRPDRMLGFYNGIDFFNIEITNRPIKKDLPNIWHGLTVCNQQEADEKIPIFLQIQGKKFLSIEPCLDLIGFSKWLYPYQGIDGVVMGAETGRNARPMHIGWARFVRDHCKTANIPFFLKYVSKKEGRILDGRTYDDLPWIKERNS